MAQHIKPLSFSVPSPHLLLRRRNFGSAAADAKESFHGTRQEKKITLPGATVATLLMLGALHARRLYEDKKVEEARRHGIEVEFHPDFKAAFLQLLPLRFLSRAFGLLASVEIPIWARPHIYRSYCRAFHADLDEVAQDLENYSSLREFFTRTLKEGCRPVENAPSCLVSPVDGIIMRCGQIQGPGAVVEQVKGFSFSLKSLLGAEPPSHFLSASKVLSVEGNETEDMKGQSQSQKLYQDVGHVVHNAPHGSLERPVSGLFYCVLYLGPGDYHRVHSPSDWNVFCRRYFSGHLFPVNERAVRTIRNLYVANERVVLEGNWSQGYMAMVVVGATNVGSIELKLEPDLKTNRARLNALASQSFDVQWYGTRNSGLSVKKGQEVAVFNLGSTVVLVFQAPAYPRWEDVEGGIDLQPKGVTGFSFTVKNGERVKMGQSLGHW